MAALHIMSSGDAAADLISYKGENGQRSLPIFFSIRVYVCVHVHL